MPQLMDSALGSPGIRTTGWRVGTGTIQDPSYVREAFARIADRYVTTNHVLSTDILWRKKVARIVRAWKPARLSSQGATFLMMRARKKFFEVAPSTTWVMTVCQLTRSSLDSTTTS
jgi:hypothetical protein